MNTLMNKLSLPYGVEPVQTIGTEITMTQGMYTLNKVVFLNDIILPEFSSGWHIQGMTVHLFNSPTCPYDVILGRDFLQTIGFNISFSDNCV